MLAAVAAVLIKILAAPADQGAAVVAETELLEIAAQPIEVVVVVVVVKALAETAGLE
jgi:hypothetical protein